MKALLFIGVCTAFAVGLIRAEKPQLEEVASFPTQQVTGVGGKPKPFPDDAWNAKEGPPGKRWVCVQSVVCDDTGALWVLDPAAPKTEVIVKGGPKLVKIDLSTNRIVQTISFDETIAPERSYLNDVRFDTKTGHAFITDSGTGALVVADLKSGKARRLLGEHHATKIEPDAEIEVDGMKIIDPKTGKAPAFHADGIAYDQAGGWLYFHALTAHTMWRVKADHLRDESLESAQIGAKLENLGKTPKPDGMLEGRESTVYLAAFEQLAIVRFNADTKSHETVIEDDRLQWPDTLAWGPQGHLYITTSQIHRMPKYHGGESKQQGPFRVYRLKLP